MSQSRAAPTTSPPPSTEDAARPFLWVVGKWRDLILIVATPVLILPLIALAKARLSLEDLALYVAAFGALGHHFPGMLRAYGDKALFKRFKVRFIVSPILLLVACIASTILDLHALKLTVVVWGIWHGLMQTYGFGRIYDAKVRSFAKRTQWLDLAMCIAWFSTAVIVSPSRMYRIIYTYHLRIGAPMPSGTTIQAIQGIALAITAVITALFLINLFVTWRAGERPSPIKLVLFATSFGFWWFSNVAVENMVVGVAMFEIFHDVQYLTIVWIFNRGRAEQGGAGGFTRFLFRKSGVFVGVYVGLVAAYGSIGLLKRGVDSELLQNVLTGVIAASTLLHFYFDGFIWKVREQKTSEALGLGGGVAKRGLRLSHAAKWSPLVLAFLLLGFIEPKRREQNFQRLEALAVEMPENGEVQRELAEALRKFGQDERAIEHYLKAVAGGIESSATSYWLGALLADQGRREEAVVHLRHAIDIQPDMAEAHVRIGNLLAAADDHAGAVEALELGVSLDPGKAGSHHGLAASLAEVGQSERAIEQYREAVRLDPGSAGSHFNLARLLFELDRKDEAAEHFRAAGDAFREKRNLDATILSYRNVVRLLPDDANGHMPLAMALEAKGDTAQARRHYGEVLRIDPQNDAARRRLEALGK